MDITTAINTIIDPDAEENTYFDALQCLINSGDVWRLQGSVGRGAMSAMKAGFVMLGHKTHNDYYDNQVPSRDDVEPGSCGSYALVVSTLGKERADHLAAL